MATCILIVAILGVLITTVTVIVAYATPNWLRFENIDGDAVCTCRNCDCGIWLYCSSGQTTTGSIEDCRWFFSSEYLVEKQLPDWFKAVQGLMSGAVATSLLSLIIGLFSLCCRCKTCNPHQAAAVFIVLTFLLIAVSVAVFGAKSYLDYNVMVLANDTSMKVSIFGWSFWVAVAAGGAALITSVFYFCVGRSDEYV
jgi:hypothetical protein